MACSRIRPVRSKSEPRIRVMTVHICNVSWSGHVHFLPRDPGHLPPEHLDERPDAINSHNLIRILRVRKFHPLAVVRMREGMNSRLRGYM